MLNRKTLIFFLLFSQNLFGQFWLPSKIKITPSGDVVHDFPFPTTADPGAAFKTVDPYFSGIKIGAGGDITNFKRIFALGGKQTGDMKETSTGVLLPPSDTNGYMVLDTKNIAVSLNVAASSVLVGGWMGIGIDFGVVGAYAHGIFTSRYAPTLEAAEKLPIIASIPKNAQEILKNWNPGDSVSVSRTMSVGFDASIGSKAYFKVGVLAAIDSSWTVSVGFPPKEYNPHKKPIVILTLGRKKDKNFSVKGTSFLGGIEWQNIWGKEEEFKYEFDLSSEKKTNLELIEQLDPKKKNNATLRDITTLLAYQEALKGNVFLADSLHKLKTFGVKKLSVDTRQTRKKNKGGSLVVPWLFKATYKQGKSQIRAQIEDIDHERKMESLLSFYSQHTGTTGIVSADLMRLNLFGGNFQQVTPIDNMEYVLERRYSGSYKYYYTKNRVSTQEFQDEIKKLRYRVGFMKELKEFQNIPEKIGSLQIELDISLSNIATDELMNLATKYSEAVLEKEALSYIDGFFGNVEDAKSEICRNYRVRNLSECIYTTKRQTSSAIKKAYAALHRMIKDKMDNDYYKFVSAFADFGEGFIENRFTMKTFLRMLRYEFNPGVSGREKFGAERKVKGPDGKLTKVPYEVTISITGTNIAPYNKVLYSWREP